METALLSLVEVQTPTGTGSGFIVNTDGLVITNKHVVRGANQVRLRLASGVSYSAEVSALHGTLDLAYLQITPLNGAVTPIAIGNSDAVRVGEGVIVLGFPLGSELGQEPTVSRGIVSAKRADVLQTDATVNPGNSGGPMLNEFGEAIGVVFSRVEQSNGRPVEGVGLAIPINRAVEGIQASARSASAATPTSFPTIPPTATPLPAIPPTIDLEATKQAIEAANAHLQTKTAIEQQRERDIQAAQEYARSLEATRVANLPTATPIPTPTPQPTATPLPTPTPHPSVYCREWEAMVLEWVYQGNNYYRPDVQAQYGIQVPNHPHLPAYKAHDLCITQFPLGILGAWGRSHNIGEGQGELLPGTYEYRSGTGDARNDSRNCYLTYGDSPPKTWIAPNGARFIASEMVWLEYGQPFTFQFLPYHKRAEFGFGCTGGLYRVGS